MVRRGLQRKHTEKYSRVAGVFQILYKRCLSGYNKIRPCEGESAGLLVDHIDLAQVAPRLKASHRKLHVEREGVAAMLHERARSDGARFEDFALALEQAGVDEIEVGIPAMGDEEVAAIAQVGQALSHATAMCWGRMTRLDVDAAVRTGLKRVSLSVPVSDLMIKAKLRGERSLVKSRIREIVPYALDHGLQVAMGGEDSSRGDLDFICEVIGEAEKAGVHRFRFADSDSRG